MYCSLIAWKVTELGGLVLKEVIQLRRGTRESSNLVGAGLSLRGLRPTSREALCRHRD